MNQIAKQTAQISPWLAEHQKLGITPMDHLFNRLMGAYPRRWAESFPSDHAIQVWREAWAEAFDAEGISFDEVKAGLDAVTRKHDWPPSLPEFLKCCRAAVDYGMALYEAREQMANRRSGTDKWSNPAFFWAAARIGDFDMLNKSHAELLPRFTAALNEVMKAGSIRPVPPRAPECLPAPGKTVAQPDRVAEEMGKIRALEPAVGNKAWAKAILERAGRGEKIAYMTLKMAKAAINGNQPMESAA